MVLQVKRTMANEHERPVKADTLDRREQNKQANARSARRR
jgi:hypothetical protein